jgi:hypothetical protein
MDKLLPLENVTERDIDLLLLEEVLSSPDFVKSLFQLVLPHTEISEPTAWHSVSDPELGESDLVIRAKLPTGTTVALLIENKVDAPPQPDQSARYRARGDIGIKESLWDSYRTLIIAPIRYLDSDAESKLYDAKLSYEEVCNRLSRNEPNSPRVSFKLSLLRQAIEQNRRGYNPKINEQITRFFHDYWLLSQRHFPELNAEDPGPRTATSTWISFRPEGISGKRKVWHKIDYAEVDLELAFPATELQALTDKYQAQLPPDVRIVKRGKSSGLRIRVPNLDRFQPLADQEREALACMRAALRLAALMNVMDRGL